MRGRFFIDATGDADVAFSAGVPCTKGRPSDGAPQPMTMKMRYFNVDINEIKTFIESHPEEFPRLKGDTSIIHKSPRLSIGGFVKILDSAKEAGEISFHREDVLLFEGNTPGEIIVNTTRIIGHDSTDPWSLSDGEMEGRRQAEELHKFLREKIPGFKNAWLAYTGPMVGVRSSRQIQGIYNLKADDIINGTIFEDVIAHSGYPIDIHSPDGKGTNTKHLQWEKYYSIPYRCLIDSRISNLITVGRCVSAEFEAQGAIRTTPTVGAIGHAGGMAAALAIIGNVKTQEVNIKELQEELKKQGAYLEI